MLLKQFFSIDKTLNFLAKLKIMSLPNPNKRPKTNAVDKLVSEETDVSNVTSVENSASKDDKVSPTAGKTQENDTENQEAETSDEPEFKTPKMARISQSSTRESAIRKKKTGRKSLDDARKQLVFDDKSEENANEINNDIALNFDDVSGEITDKEAPPSGKKTPEKNQVAPPSKPPPPPSGRKKKRERKSLQGVDDVITKFKYEDDKE